MQDRINMNPGEITTFINQNWIDLLLRWVKENELWRDSYNDSQEVGTGVLKHI